MVHLTVGQLGIVRLQVGEHLGGLVKRVRTALKNSILGDVRQEEMAVDGPSTHASCKKLGASVDFYQG